MIFRKELIFLTLVILVNANVYSLTKKERNEFKKDMIQSCYTKQRSNPVNDIASDNQIKSYCSCISDEVMSAPNFDDVVIGMENGDLPPSFYNNLIQAAAYYCSKKIVNTK